MCPSLLHVVPSYVVHAGELPCDGDDTCMVCKQKPSSVEGFACTTCATPWHVPCLPPRSRPETIDDAAQWQCPDYSNEDIDEGTRIVSAVVVAVAGGDLVAAIREIERDEWLIEWEKAKKRQELLSGRTGEGAAAVDVLDGVKEKEKGGGIIEILDRTINCSFCMQLPKRPVTVSSCLPRALSTRFAIHNQWKRCFSL